MEETNNSSVNNGIKEKNISNEEEVSEEIKEDNENNDSNTIIPVIPENFDSEPMIVDESSENVNEETKPIEIDTDTSSNKDNNDEEINSAINNENIETICDIDDKKTESSLNSECISSVPENKMNESDIFVIEDGTKTTNDELDQNSTEVSNEDLVKNKENTETLNEINDIVFDNNIMETDKEIDNTLVLDNEQNKNTEFVHVNDEKDDEKDSTKGDELLEDPIGGGEGDNPDSMTEGADEEVCIIPDTDRVLSQEEKDSACALTPLKDLSSTSNENGDCQKEETEDSNITVIKYKDQDPRPCYQCSSESTTKYEFIKDKTQSYLCCDNCLEEFKKQEKVKIILNWETEIRVKDLTPKDSNVTFSRKCATCSEEIIDCESNLTWEIMDFCNEICLTKYQKEKGSKCASCSGDVKSNSLGKYCVRFGNDIRQFCKSNCLENFKKGLKVCSYCQQNMSNEPQGFLAIGDEGQFKDFCSQICLDQYDIMTNNRPPKVDEDTTCCVCKLNKKITMSYEFDGNTNYFCGEPCFVAFSFVNSIKSDKCSMCRRNFSSEILEKHTIFYENVQKSFCSNSCQNIYIMAHRKIVPCTWCKVKKYNFDMIRRFNNKDPLLNMCSVNCLNLYKVSINAATSKKTECDYCTKNLQAMYHLTMSDATIRNFCSYSCVMSFQNQFTKSPITMKEDAFPVPTGVPKKSKRIISKSTVNSNNTQTELTLPVISNVKSLANSNTNIAKIPTTSKTIPVLNNVDIPVQVKHHIIFKSSMFPTQRNIATMCRTRISNKGVNATQKVENVQVQTDDKEADKILIPIPVPIFVPLPMHMFTAPVPMPVPIPIPVPVPVFIPTTRNSAAGIMKEIKKIQVKIPTNPYEAELLAMAELVADDKKEENTDSESDVEDNGADDNGGGSFSPETQDGSNTFGDDMLQMALKMATELDEPAVDLEGALTANTITASQSQDDHTETTEEVSQEQLHLIDRGQRGKKRGMRGNPRCPGSHVSKRGRRSLSQHTEIPIITQPPPPPEPQEKPDANMCLKYTFGVNAWKQWVTFKNAELEKSLRRVKLFKTEILQLTADELNYSLCLFVKEVRKPNGAEYAPDTIYYLCLGIQQYLFENGRIDNIFCDTYYEKFTDCLDEVARRFSVLYNDSHYIVTRVEEEHLWESKQLGAHSPHVLLSTLMFFNTKHFNLTTVDEHMQLSFSHIMKHWKRNPNQAGASKLPGSRNVLLRFYPPQSAIQNNARKKKVYEQQENEENPLRCPVKLYEFYLSKCPESVKTRNDVFYLQPERSCVPDSPVWYSTMPLPKDALEKMLHRVKMVKEINVALLTS